MKLLADSSSTIAIPRWQRRVWWSVLCCYVLVLVTLTHLPHPPVHQFPVRNDKILHFCAYLAFGFLLGMRTITSWRKAACFLGLLQAFAAIDEISQRWVRRHSDVMDWLADSCGAACGLLLGIMLYQLLRRFAQICARFFSSPASTPAESETDPWQQAA